MNAKLNMDVVTEVLDVLLLPENFVGIDEYDGFADVTILTTCPTCDDTDAEGGLVEAHEVHADGYAYRTQQCEQCGHRESGMSPEENRWGHYDL